jgi:UDP-N-acetylmuramate: L-alanyl-gamma-D-glutamyl-meso-diaminopimelate ligase
MLVGGVAQDFGTNYRLGGGRDFVIEGDEYDTAFFDKGPKFLHYHASGAIITAVEFDHADIYRDLDHVKSSFRALAQQMDEPRTLASVPDQAYATGAKNDAGRAVTEQAHGAFELAQRSQPRVLVVCADFPHALEVSAASHARRLTFGLKAGEFRATDIAIGPGGARFSIEHDGAPIAANLELPIGGRMNVANALGVWVLLREFGLDDEELARGLRTFAGVKRRQEIVGEARGITIIDDFAHHPTAIGVTLEAVAERYAGRRILAAFEPRSNTARRSVFQHGFAGAFDRAARVYLGAVYFKENDPLPPGDRLDTDALASTIAARGPVASSFANTDAILERMVADAQPGDVVVCMSNGPFDGLPQRVLAALR